MLLSKTDKLKINCQTTSTKKENICQTTSTKIVFKIYKIRQFKNKNKINEFNSYH
jgi:hypothetical protein